MTGAPTGSKELHLSNILLVETGVKQLYKPLLNTIAVKHEKCKHNTNKTGKTVTKLFAIE